MKKYFRVATMAYLVILGIVLGAGIYAGAVVAPVIFNSANWLGSNVLSHYQEGQIMTENFIRLSYLVDFGVAVIFLYEAFRYKMGERDGIAILAALMAIASGLFFGHYYMPDIISMQQAGELMTQTDKFAAFHRASEIDFQVFVVAILVLMVQNMRRACK